MLLAINPGSSNLKYSVFDDLNCLEQDTIYYSLDNDSSSVKKQLKNLLGKYSIDAVGYRVVHGKNLDSPKILTKEVIDTIKSLTSFAPLHQPASIYMIECFKDLLPNAIHFACFDTSFHKDIPFINKIFPLPREYFEKGIYKYGFHGLAYSSVIRQLKNIDENLIKKPFICAHLGSGSSICAIKDSKSFATTMGFSALNGLMMGSRTGSIDPGVILYMLKQEKLTPDEIEDILYKKSGLLGVSCKSAKFSELSIDNAFEKEAIDLYINRIIQELFGLIGLLGDISFLTFSGGIGENSEYVRSKVMNSLKIFTGIKSYVINVDEQLEMAYYYNNIN